MVYVDDYLHHVQDDRLSLRQILIPQPIVELMRTYYTGWISIAKGSGHLLSKMNELLFCLLMFGFLQVLLPVP